MLEFKNLTAVETLARKDKLLKKLNPMSIRAGNLDFFAFESSFY